VYIGLQVKYRLFCTILMKLEFSGQIFEKYADNNFHENTSVGAESLHSDGRTDEQTDMTKLFAILPTHPKSVISGFRREVHEKCALSLSLSLSLWAIPQQPIG